jgi:hypothetical protein
VGNAAGAAPRREIRDQTCMPQRHESRLTIVTLSVARAFSAWGVTSSISPGPYLWQCRARASRELEHQRCSRVIGFATAVCRNASPAGLRPGQPAANVKLDLRFFAGRKELSNETPCCHCVDMPCCLRS